MLLLNFLKGFFKKMFCFPEEEINPMVEDPELKLSEMIKLFGDKNAKEILAMETEMQMKFEKIKDFHSAQLWPCLPLNMKFDF